MKLYLIRHGQSEANLKGIYSGQTINIKLTEQGEQEAKRAGEWLKGLTFDKVYTSDLHRAVRTAELVLPQYKAEQLAMLREFDVGTLAGLSIDEMDEEALRYRLLHDFTHYGGENDEMVLSRAERFLSLITSLPYENVAAFSHMGFMSRVLNVILGVKQAPVFFNCSNCGICVLEYKDKKWRVLHWNVAPFEKIDVA